MRSSYVLALLLIVSSVACSDPAPPAAGSADHAATAHDHAPGAADHDHPADPPADGEAWTCTMHPEVRMHAEGRCPKCNMELVKEGSVATPGAAMDYYCPMHPEERSHEQGRCSQCNMFLVKKGDEASHGKDMKKDGAMGDMKKDGAMGNMKNDTADKHDHGAH